MNRTMAVAMLAGAALMTGCSGSGLDGTWRGTVDCGPGTEVVDMEWKLTQAAESRFEGDGSVLFPADEGAERELNFVMSITVVSDENPTDLGIACAECMFTDTGDTTQCPSWWDEAWDRSGKSVYGTISSLVGMPGDCAFELEK